MQTKLFSLEAFYLHLEVTYVLQPRWVPSLKRSVSLAPWLVITILIALSSLADLNRAWLPPIQLVGSQFDFSSKMVFISSLYAEMHSSTSMLSLPSMIAIRLSRQSRHQRTVTHTYPPVLVPPMRSNKSHGFTGGRLANPRSLFSRAIIPFKIYSVDSPRTPPPSRDNRHSPVWLRGLTSACFIAV